MSFDCPEEGIATVSPQELEETFSLIQQDIKKKIGIAVQITHSRVTKAWGHASGGGDWKAERVPDDLLRRSLEAIRRDSAFLDRRARNDMMHAINGATGGSEEGKALWLEWDGQGHPDGAPNDPQKAEEQWDRIDPSTVRAGAGFICQRLERLGRLDLVDEITQERARQAFGPVSEEQVSGLQDDDTSWEPDASDLDGVFFDGDAPPAPVRVRQDHN